MKKAVTGKSILVSKPHSMTLLHKGCKQSGEMFRNLGVGMALVFSAITLSTGEVHAAESGRIGHSSNGSIQIRMTVPERLDVLAPEFLSPDRLTTTSSSTSWKNHTLCVQGNRIDHYSLTASGNSGKMVLSSNDSEDIPYQIVLDEEGNNVILPADGSGERLVVKTDETCENPSSINIDIPEEEKLKNGNYSGAAILNIGAE